MPNYRRAHLPGGKISHDWELLLRKAGGSLPYTYWAIKNYNSRNGIWIQIDEMKLISGGEFQIGGQRFIVQLS